eukprot:gene30180-65080_t
MTGACAAFSELSGVLADEVNRDASSPECWPTRSTVNRDASSPERWPT